MKGNNELVLNQATMIEAVQMYLNSQMKDGLAPTVQSVKTGKSGSYGTEDSFSISVTEAPPAA